MAAAETVTQAELGRDLGVTRQRVNNLVRAGRIVLDENGRIDPVRAKAAIAAAADPRKGRNGRSIMTEPASAETGAGASRDNHAPADDDGAAAARNLYSKARAAKEANEARLAELRLHERLGDLVDAKTVRAEQFRAARAVRNAVLAVPARLGLGRGERDLVRRELEKALEAVSDAFSGNGIGGDGASDGDDVRRVV